MPRSSVLAASCSSRVLWRRPHFLRGWRLPPALMAYGEGVGVGLHGISSVGVVYFVLLVRPWSFYPRGDCCGGFGLVLLCDTLFVFACARGHTTLALFVPSGLGFVCLVAVVCCPVACGSLPSVSRGFPPYHHFFPLGLPTRYALIPSLFRSAVLVASCSSCFLWWCPHFLQRWRPLALLTRIDGSRIHVKCSPRLGGELLCAPKQLRPITPLTICPRMSGASATVGSSI